MVPGQTKWIGGITGPVVRQSAASKPGEKGHEMMPVSRLSPFAKGRDYVLQALSPCVSMNGLRVGKPVGSQTVPVIPKSPRFHT